ncbi:MAG: DJ-1/PfpI family protein [Planctomycetes bacterium]|nr:DJ-1/PfpI family protein [Planctomycetota bacterium]
MNRIVLGARNGLVAAIVVVGLALDGRAQDGATAAEFQASPDHGRRRNVAVLVFEGVELLDFAGPVEVFTQAQGWDAPLRVFTVGVTTHVVRTLNGVQVVPDFSVDSSPPCDILVIPGGEVACLDGDTPLARFIRERVPKAEVAFSVCNGAFSLASAGFLDGLDATTHWSAIGWLREAAPKARVHADRRFTDNGHILTAAGISAGIDGALHLVERLLGPECAVRAARRMEYDWRAAPTTPQPAADPIESARRAWYAEDWPRVANEYGALALRRAEDAVVQARLGTALLFTRRTEEALPHLELARKLGSPEPRSLQALGLALTRLGRTGEALEPLLAARELAPDDLEIARSLGEAQTDTGRYGDALANLVRARASGRGDARMDGRIARCRAALGDVDGALKELDEALRREHPEPAKLLEAAEFDALRKDARFEALVARAKGS